MLANKVKKQFLTQQFATTQGSSNFNQYVFLGLLKSAPVDDETGTNNPTYEEITGTGYNRAFLSEAVEGSYNNRVLECIIENNTVTIRNKDSIFVSECEADDWEAATYFGIFTSKTGGNLIAWGEIKDAEGEPTSLKPAEGQIPVIRVNQLSISLE